VVAFVSELGELGFERLGVKWEAPPGWERMHSLELVSRAHTCFASCAIFNGQPSLHLLTTFTDGTVVVTWFGSANHEQRTRRFVHRNLRGDSVVELLAVHADEVERQRAKGKEPCDDWTAQGRLDASCAFYVNPDNPLALAALRERAFWLSAVCDLMLAAVWLTVLFMPMAPALQFALVANASATMAASHFYGTRGSSRGLAWIATAIAAASTAVGAIKFLGLGAG
jgi:hypothetical protein